MKMDSKLILFSDEKDVQYFKDTFKKRLSKTKLVATNLSAKISLEENNLKYADLSGLKNYKDVNKIIKLSDELSEKLATNLSLSKVFEIEKTNLLTLLPNHLRYFYWRILELYSIITNLLRSCNKKKLIIFEKNINKSINSPLNADFSSLTALMLSRTDPTFELQVLNTMTANNKSIYKYLLSIIRLAYKFVDKTRAFSLSKKYEVLLVLPAMHALKLVGLFKHLQEKKITYLLLTYNLTTREKMELLSRGINFVEKKALIDRKTISESKKYDFLIKKRWSHLELHPFFNNLNNKRLNQYVNKITKYKIKMMLDTFFFKNLIEDVLISKKILNRKVKVLITTTDPDTKILPFIERAKTLGVKTVTIQHGAYANVNTVNYASDTLIAWGNYYKEWFKKKLKKDGKKIIVCGSPFFDDMTLKPFIASVEKSQPVLILTTNPGFNYIKFFEDLKTITIGLSRIGIKKIYVRPHPWQGLEMAIKYLNDISKSEIFLALKRDLNYYLNQSGIVITMDTTAGFDALIKGKALIYWDHAGDKQLPFQSAGISLASRPNDVVNLAREIIKGDIKFDNDKRNVLIGKIFYSLDGQANKRIAQFIHRLI